MPALTLIGRTIADYGVARCTWYLDEPVSNSGRLKAIMAGVAEANGWAWDVQIVMNPDTVLSAARSVVATADSAILDACRQWSNLAREVIDRHFMPARLIVNLSWRGS